MNRIIPSCRTASHANGREGRGAEGLHCAALPRTEPRHPLPKGTNTLRTYSSSQLLHTASEINVIVHVREGDGPWKTAISINVPSFYFHSSSSNQSTRVICSRQPYHLDWQQKKRRHQQSFPCAGGTQYGAVVNYRRRVCQTYSEPREERAACSSLQQGKRQGGQGIEVRLPVSSPLRTGHGL